MSKIKIAILGFGQRGYVYADIIRQYPEEMEIVAVCEVNENKKPYIMNLFSITEENFYTDYKEMFKKGKLADILVISTMDQDHYQQAMEALEIGYDIMLEKPIATTKNHIVDIRDKANKLQRKVAVAHVLRYTPFYQKLKEIDPISANKMLPQNYKRVMRALEVFHLTGIPIWKHHEEHKRNVDFDFRQFGLEWDRDVLYENIEQRVDRMLEQGLIDEVKLLKNKGYHSDINAFNTVGYKEIFDYLDGKISLQRAIELIKRNTRRFAKRQLTWFRADKRIKWLKINNSEELSNAPNIIIKSIHE